MIPGYFVQWRSANYMQKVWHITFIWIVHTPNDLLQVTYSDNEEEDDVVAVSDDSVLLSDSDDEDDIPAPAKQGGESDDKTGENDINILIENIWKFCNRHDFYCQANYAMSKCCHVKAAFAWNWDCKRGIEMKWSNTSTTSNRNWT